MKKTCERCGDRLDSAARAALSRVCSGCALEGGEMRPGACLPITLLRSREDQDAMLYRLDH